MSIFTINANVDDHHANDDDDDVVVVVVVVVMMRKCDGSLLTCRQSAASYIPRRG